MHQKTVTLLCIFLLLCASVQAQQPSQSGRNEFVVTSEGGYELRPKSSSPEVDYVEVILHHIAQDEAGIEADSPKFSGEYVATDNVLRWDNPSLGIQQFSFTQDIAIQSPYLRVPRKTEFPLSDLPEDVQEYLAPSSKIDADHPAIKRLASELAEGSDDQFVIVTKIGSWVTKNIEYDLSTLTEEVSQPASWVLEKRVGVCDELSALFIALLRSIGIPARFVYGLSYTDATSAPTNWGPHGWAEVYFPGTGWVAFDPTYTQYGWLDSSHIKLGASVDPDDASVEYRWKSRDVDLTARPLEFKVKVVDDGRDGGGRIRVDAEASIKRVRFGSYNALILDLKNEQPHYVATQLKAVPVAGIEFIPAEEIVTLRPGESRRVQWLAHVTDDLNPSFRYTVPITVTGDHGEEAQTSFEVDAQAPQFERAFFPEPQDEKVTVSKTQLACSPKQNYFYVGEVPSVQCIVKNAGTTPLRDLTLCLDATCKQVELLVSEEKRISLDHLPKQYGGFRSAVVVRDRSDRILSREALGFDYWDVPEISVDGDAPETILFDEMADVSFKIRPVSQSTPVNVTARFQAHGMRNEWTFESLTEEQQFNIVIPGHNIVKGKNDLQFMVTYYDLNGRNFTRTKILSSELGPLSTTEQAEYYFTRAYEGLEKLFSKII